MNTQKHAEILKAFARYRPLFDAAEKLGYQPAECRYDKKNFGNLYLAFDRADSRFSIAVDRGFASADLFSKTYPYADFNIIDVLLFVGIDARNASLGHLAELFETHCSNLVAVLGDRDRVSLLLEAKIEEVPSLSELNP